MRTFTLAGRLVASALVIASFTLACGSSRAAQDAATPVPPATQDTAALQHPRPATADAQVQARASLAQWRASMTDPSARDDRCHAAAMSTSARAGRSDPGGTEASPMCEYLAKCCAGGTQGAGNCCAGYLARCGGGA